MQKIPLWNRRGEIAGYALMDDVDATRMAAWRWYRQPGGYVVRQGPNRRLLLLHREILGLRSYSEDPVQVDHINRDPSDNQRANLRLATTALNMQNQPPESRVGRAKLRGVAWDSWRRRWRAKLTLNGRRYHFGYYDTPEQAGEAAAAARARMMPYSPEALTAPPQ